MILFSFLHKLRAINNFLGSVIYIYAYHPYRRGENPLFNRRTSGKILDLKEKKSAAINFFSKEIIKSFPVNISGNEIVICCAASSDKDKVSTGIKELCQKVAQDCGYIDGTSIIIRTKTIQKLANGGSRSYSTQKDSLSTSLHIDLSDKTVYLVDDIVTTGVTLRACHDILKKNGANEIHCFAIGRTH